MYRNFSSLVPLLPCIGCVQSIYNMCLLIYHLLRPPQILLHVLIFYSIFPSFTTHLSQHTHIYCPHFLHVLYPHWPIFCSISQSWSNQCFVKPFLQSCWNVSITKHSKRKSLLQLSSSYRMFGILLILPFLTTYRAKVSERNLCGIS